MTTDQTPPADDPRERIARAIEATADRCEAEFEEPPVIRAFREAARIARETPAASGWVSVDDRLPDRAGKYLVHCPSLDPDSPLIGTGWHEPGEGWSLVHPYWIGFIRHWRELPAPPAPEPRP